MAASPFKKADPAAVLAIIYRGVQVLLVAHGAALLTLVTTYVGADGVVPESIRRYIFELGLGFLSAIVAALAFTVTEVAALTPVTAKDTRVSNRFSVGLVLCAAVSLLLLVLVVADILSLSVPLPA